MKNNTKIRLHLSKQLFESLTKQVIAEAKMKKNLGAGMTEVKGRKDKKKEEEPLKEMETMTAEAPGMKKPIAEMTTGDMEFYNIGKWAADFLGLAVDSEGDLIQLGGNVLTAATLGTLGAATGLIMYSDNIKAGIKKAGQALKSLVKGKSAEAPKGVTEGTGEDVVSKLSPKTIAALKK